jgi:hypothetical protein
LLEAPSHRGSMSWRGHWSSSPLSSSLSVSQMPAPCQMLTTGPKNTEANWDRLAPPKL